jgi:Flp pilus assembly protein TadB
MSALLIALCGAIIGLGCLISLIGTRGGRLLSSFSLRQKSTKSRIRPAFFLAPCVGAAIIFITGWIIVGVVASVVIGLVPGIGAAPAHRRDEQAIVEAIASWTEQLRDTLAGSHGLEQVIIATAPHAPVAIALAVERLSIFIAYGSLSDGLRRFAEDVDHPTADFVTAALVTAAQHQARDIGLLLGHLAQCARDEGRMRTRVWVGRARTRSAVRIITSVVALFVGGLFVFNREYLEPYSSVSGQFILGVILVGFAIALFMMHNMSQIETPERFIRKRTVVLR